jgi:hypothetical protein
VDNINDRDRMQSVAGGEGDDRASDVRYSQAASNNANSMYRMSEQAASER